MRHAQVHLSIPVVGRRVEDDRVVVRRNKPLVSSPQVSVYEARLHLVLRQDGARLRGRDVRNFRLGLPIVFAAVYTRGINRVGSRSASC